MYSVMLFLDMDCERCGDAQDGSFGSGRFCSLSCSKSPTPEIRLKISEGVKNSPKFQASLGKRRQNLKKNPPGICEKCDVTHDGLFGSGRFCSRACANSRERSPEVRRKISVGVKRAGKATVVKKIVKICPICKNTFDVWPCNAKRVYCSRQCYYVDKEQHFRKKAPGGIRKGAGAGKKGWYKGYHCDSTYELAWVVYNLEHNIEFKRNKKGFDYIYSGKKLKYFPDFYLEKENCYIEIKGYSTKQVEAKIKQFSHKLKVLYKKDLAPIFVYVKNKYEYNFHEKLYENINPLKNTCEVCNAPARYVYCSRRCSGLSLHSNKKHDPNRI